ncbi:MAG: S1 RNA-binding domain-containing protein [Armatimonadota bacterium]
MTETLENAETQRQDLKALLEEWVESPPPSVTQALSERGLGTEALEEYARSGISTDEVENLRRVLVQAAANGQAEDASLLARLTPLLDPRERAWDRVMRAKASGEVLTATVTEAVKGGVVVDLGVRGFIPSSQLGLSVPRNLGQFVGQTLKMRVLDVDRRRHTVILSNRQIMEEERAQKRRGALERLQEGEERRGTVRRLTDIGAFVDVGGVDGLLHVSEISWKRVDHPSDVLKVGQKIPVKVLRVDPDAGRVSLSMRQTMTDPLEEARRKYAVGSLHTVKVSKLDAKGVEVEVSEGLEGWMPISELGNQRVNNVEEVVHLGQEVEATVIDIRPRERKIVFSMRKLEQRRERQVVENYQRRSSRSDRTTLGDLFGHLFEEYQPEPEEQPQAAATEPAEEKAADGATAVAGEVTAEATAGETAAVAQDESGAVDAAAVTEEAPAEAATEETPAEQAEAAEDVTAEEPVAEAPVAEVPAAEEPATEDASGEETAEGGEPVAREQ